MLGVSEVRWLGFGRVRTSKGEVILYSVAEEIHIRGVGIKGVMRCNEDDDDQGHVLDD